MQATLGLSVAEEPGEFVLIASWDTEEAMREHYDSPHYRHFREQVGPLLARPSDVVVYHVSGTFRVRDPNPPDPGLLGIREPRRVSVAENIAQPGDPHEHDR